MKGESANGQAINAAPAVVCEVRCWPGVLLNTVYLACRSVMGQSGEMYH